MSNKTFDIKIIKISQPIGDFYVGKIKAKKLIELSFSDIRKIREDKDDKFIGLQRNLNSKKIKKIKEYLNSFDATFPNSVVLTINNEDVISEQEGLIQINDTDDIFSIIDGQHRLAGLEGEEDFDDFDVIVTIFKDLNESEQATLFSTINSEQSKVDPSLKYNLELESIIDTPRKFISLLVETFNYFEKSPFKGKIKILGSNTSEEDKINAILSGSGFARELEDILYKDTDYYKIRNILHENGNHDKLDTLSDFEYSSDKFILWNYYLNDNINGCFKMLYNYFKSFEDNFPKDWNDSNSIIIKTTGFRAVMKLFVDIYNDLNNNKKTDFSKEDFNTYIVKLKKLDGTINSSNFSSSGGGSAVELYKIFKSRIF